MKQRLGVRFCVAVCVLFAAAFRVGAAEGKEPLNVLMIAVDDLNNWVGAMSGPAKTPNIDRLAASGRLFTNAHCVVPACNPSRLALFTGQRPETTGQYGNRGNFRDNPGGNERLPCPSFWRKRATLP